MVKIRVWETRNDKDIPVDIEVFRIFGQAEYEDDDHVFR